MTLRTCWSTFNGVLVFVPNLFADLFPVTSTAPFSETSFRWATAVSFESSYRLPEEAGDLGEGASVAPSPENVSRVFVIGLKTLGVHLLSSRRRYREVI